MRSTADTADSSHLQGVQGTTGGTQLVHDDLLALRAFFLLLDAWDRNSKPATPVDTLTEPEQGERHTCSVGARRERAA
jgi:hypothetical protein